MPEAPIGIPLETARRLAVRKQWLAGPRPAADLDTLRKLLRDIRCLQLDPTSAVARNHLLVLHSRLGAFDPAWLDRLLWEERWLMEDWAHAASICMTEDYPILAHARRAMWSSQGTWNKRMRAWAEENRQLRDHIIGELELRGPLRLRDLQGPVARGWVSSGWNTDRNANQMLSWLWLEGLVMVSGRNGAQKQYDLTERVLPEWARSAALDEREAVLRAAEISLRALGVARPIHIKRHFVRDWYPGLAEALSQLESEGRIVRARVEELDERSGRSPWYIHHDDVQLLDQMQGADWGGRPVLLSPFDNLICDRRRTEELFGFVFRLEIYTPSAKRRHGFFVMPVLDGDRLVARIDARMDRKAGVFRVEALHVEDGEDVEAARAATHRAAAELAGFLGAEQVVMGEGW